MLRILFMEDESLSCIRHHELSNITLTSAIDMNQVSEEELLVVIKDFLEMGHVDNIAAMFVQEPSYFCWTGAILDDERFNVRLGVLVLFEVLKQRAPNQLELAIPSLLPLLQSISPHIRGEAISVLGIIGTLQAREQIVRMLSDSHPLVVEVAQDILAELGENNMLEEKSIHS